LRHLLSFQRAHNKDATVSGWGSETNPSPSWLSWLMHGGEAGLAWANQKVSKIDMSGPPEGYQYRDFLDQAPDLEKQHAAAQRTSQEELASDAEYAAILNKSDDRILRSRGAVLPPNPLAPKEPPTPGSEEEYRQLLDRLDPRINMRKRS
jgi:hypothetical protein